MGDRGKRSGADLSIVPVIPTLREGPPAQLTQDEAVIWTSIVESLPPDWFRPSDVPLLAAYCQTAIQCQAAAEELRGSTLTLQTRQGRMYRNPLLDIQDAAARRLATLAGKLRLCPSSRMRAETAATKGRPIPGRKPWDSPQ